MMLSTEGVRLVPEGNGRYRVAVVNQWVTKHVWRRVSPDSFAGALVVRCPYPGIGDHLLCLALAKGAKQMFPDRQVVLLAGDDSRAHWCGLFDGADAIVVGDLDGPTLSPCRDTDYSTAPPIPWWQDMEERCGVPAVLPTPRPLWPDATRAAWPHYGAVVLCPSAGVALRRWPRQHWLDLEWMLRDRGHKTVVLDIGKGGQPPAHWRGPVLTDWLPHHAGAVIAGAACVVTGDTGLAHVAGCYRRPTLCLNAMWPGSVLYRLYPTVRMVNGPLGCGPCYDAAAAKARAGCTNACLSLAAIAPEPVFRQAVALADPELCLHATLRRMVPRWKPRSYLEIGVRNGDSLNVVLDESGGRLERIALADTWGGDYGGSGHGSHDHIALMLAGRNRDDYRRVTARVVYLDGDSKTALPTLHGETFDLITVDGDHSEAGATADLENALPLLAPGGRIVFDDVVHPDHHYLRSVGEAFAARHPELHVELCNLYHPHGVIVFRKRLAEPGRAWPSDSPLTLPAGAAMTIDDGLWPRPASKDIFTTESPRAEDR